MSFLASVLPGLRDFRSPFSAGVLWLVALTFVLFPHKDVLSRSSKSQDIISAASAIPQTVAIAGLAFAAYILGIVGTAGTQRLMRFLVPSVSGWTSAHANSRWAQLAIPFDSYSLRARGLLEQHIRSRIGRLSEAIAGLVVVELVEDDNELTAFSLSKDAPEQFQQYDKTLAEGEFREAVALPILVVSIAASTYLGPFWPLIVIFGLITYLVLQARSAFDFRRASELLATTVYLGYTSPPSLVNLEARMSAELNKPRSERNYADDVVWYLKYISNQRLSRYVDSVVISKLRHPSRAKAVYEAMRDDDASVKALRDRLFPDLAFAPWSRSRPEANADGARVEAEESSAEAAR